jgi:hypothetical protein
MHPEEKGGRRFFEFGRIGNYGNIVYACFFVLEFVKIMNLGDDFLWKSSIFSGNICLDNIKRVFLQ